MKKYLVILICLFTICSCTEEESPYYEGGHYIYFRNSYTSDSIEMSFFFYPGQDKVPVWLKLESGGDIFTKDVPVKFSVDKDLSTAAEEDYDLPTDAVFHAGHQKDSTQLFLNYTPKLDDKRFKLVVNLDASDAYTPGPKLYRKAVIIFTAIPSRPEWWDSDIENVYLGKYSDLKYETLMSVTKVSDWSNLESPEKRALALQFKYYLQKCAEDPEIGPVLDEDGRPMTVTVIG